MKRNDAQLGKPQVLYKDTKANIEALTELAEGSIAYATDTNEDGTYDGSTWTWGRSGGTGSGGAFQRVLASNLTLDDGECLVVTGYLDTSTHTVTLNGDSRLEIL